MKNIISNVRAEIRAKGWRATIRDRGWKLIAAVIAYYLVRDSILYIALPILIKNYGHLFFE